MEVVTVAQKVVTTATLARRKGFSSKSCSGIGLEIWIFIIRSNLKLSTGHVHITRYCNMIWRIDIEWLCITRRRSVVRCAWEVSLLIHRVCRDVNLFVGRKRPVLSRHRWFPTLTRGAKLTGRLTGCGGTCDSGIGDAGTTSGSGDGGDKMTILLLLFYHQYLAKHPND